MTRWRCNSCQGTYEDLSADGVPYYHACPPLTLTYVALPGGKEHLLEGEMRPGEVVVRVESPERPNKRDENLDPAHGHRMRLPDGTLQPLVKPMPDGAREVPPAIKAEGLGRTKVGG